MRIAIGCDHNGLILKEELIKFLKDKKYDVSDFGTYSKDPVDYPDIAFMVCLEVARGNFDYGIIIDGTGIASAIAANKVRGIRATPCYNTTMSKSAREHNDSNILTLGAGIVGSNIAKDIVNVFLETKFLGERHQKRLNKIAEYENSTIENKIEYERPREIITQDDLIFLLKEGKKVIYITEKTIITPLAREFAIEKGIRLIKR